MQRTILGLGLMLAILAGAVLPLSTYAFYVYNPPGGETGFNETIYDYYVSPNGLPIFFEGSCLPPYSWANHYTVFTNGSNEIILTDPYNPSNSLYFINYLEHEYDPIFILNFSPAFSPAFNGYLTIAYGINTTSIGYGIELNLTVNNGQGYLVGSIDGSTLFYAYVGQLQKDKEYAVGFWYNASTQDIGFIWFNGTTYTYYLTPCVSGDGPSLVLSNQDYFIFLGSNNGAYIDWTITEYGTAPFYAELFPIPS